ncbi:MAG: hypothetical protein IJA85_00590 [Clostridia bacterium]|nr:hypothetical protein [Clostridia bacterium]
MKRFTRSFCCPLLSAVMLFSSACSGNEFDINEPEDITSSPAIESTVTVIPETAPESDTESTPIPTCTVISAIPGEGQKTIELGYFDEAATLTDYTGNELEVGLDDPKYGGGQFIGKLFTEGLGRGPLAEEYLYYTKQIEERGCSVELFCDIVTQFFSSAAFTELKLAPEFEVMAVYRAILNRDPTLDEVSDYKARIGAEGAAAIALSLVKTDEFAALLPDIIRGPYFWGANNAAYSPAGIIITSDELNDMLNAAKKDKILELEPGTLVLMNSSITVPIGMTLTTRGNPTHYTMMARVLRTERNADRMVIVDYKSTLTHVWVDGNRTAFADQETLGGNAGAPIGLMEEKCTVTYCRANGTIGGTNFFCADLTSDHYIAHNLITAYESNHSGGWSDGITHASNDSIIEYNTIVDATDVGIVIFRFAGGKQNTIVRHNTILNLGNSAYGGVDIDAWNNQEQDQDFTGMLFENNTFWTSYKAHQHICLSFATLAWHNVIGDEAYGGPLMINNYTPEGLFVLCGAVFAADGCHDFTARGNHISAYLGPYGRSDYNRKLRERISSINPETADGDLQGEYEELTMWLPYQPFIIGHTAPPLESALLKEVIFHENRVTLEQLDNKN